MSAASELTCEIIAALVAPDVPRGAELRERLRVAAEAHATLRRLGSDERRSRRARLSRRAALRGGELLRAMRATN